MVNGESHTNVHILELLLLYLLPVDTEMPSKQAITGVGVCLLSRQGKGRGYKPKTQKYKSGSRW